MASDAYVGLGSNLGDRVGALCGAIAGLRRVGRVLKISSLYESDPVGGPPQGPYLNLVVRMATDLSAVGLAEELFRLEQAAGRVRTVRWGPRTLDLDLLLYDAVQSDDPALTLPHPRLFSRRFVLEPLAEVHPAGDTLGLSVALARVAHQTVRNLGNWPQEEDR